MTTTITDVELVERLRDILDRVHDCGEQFVLEHDGKPITMLGPIEEKKAITWAEFVERLRSIPRPDDKFADDLEGIISGQRPIPATLEWPYWLAPTPRGADHSNCGAT